MICPVGTKVRVLKGAAAFIYTYEDVGPIPEVGFEADPVSETFEGITADIDFRKELRDPKSTTKVVDPFGKAWLFTDAIARRYVELL